MLKTVRAFFALMQNQKKEIVFSVVLSFIDGFFIMIPFIIAFKIVNDIPLFNPAASGTLDVRTMYRYIGIMAAAVFIRIVLRYFTLYFRGGAGYKAMCRERKNLGTRLRKVSLGFLNEKNTGDLVSTITSDAAFLEIEGMVVIEKIAVGIPVFAIGLTVLLVFDYRIFLLTAFLFIPVWYMYRKLSTLQDKLKINRQDFIGKVTADIVEFINGIHVLKIYNMAEKRFSKTAEAVKNLRDFSVRAELAHIPVVSLFQFCLRLVTAGIVFSSALLFLRGTLSFAHIFLLMTASFGLFSGIEAMGIFSIFSKMTQQSIDRMNAIKAVPEMQNLSGNLLLDPQKPHAFDIQFEDVSFAYAEKEVLHNISFSVPEKTVTALAGLSGSGKTSIVNLLARFWDIQKGRISIGGTDIKELNYENLLHNISFVFQDVFLFNDTILNNIKLGREDASLEEVYQAAERAGCTDFIRAEGFIPRRFLRRNKGYETRLQPPYKNNTPRRRASGVLIMQSEKGYDTVIGEAGLRLSGGEKQRISIARAFLKNAPIVLLDEVTANVDAENEAKIQAALQELLKDKTVIMIAHKLTSLRNAGQILVIENGHIAQCGRHEELIKEEGLYRKLWEESKN